MMKVKDLMSTQVVTIEPQEAIKDAIDKMNAGRFRRIPVIDRGKLTGIITDRDIRQALNSPVIFHERVYDEYLLKEIKVETCMTADPITISPCAEIIDAARHMEMRKIGGLPVVENESLVGIITVSDLMGFLIAHLKEHS